MSPAALGAVFCPREAVVEPWLVAHGYAESARLHGVEMRLATEAVGATLAAPGVWEVRTRASPACQSGRSKPGELLVQPPAAAADDAAPRAPTDSVRARVVINCAGLYGDIVESWRPGGGAADGEWRMAHCDSQVGADAAFHITPRKGQFVVLAPPAGATPPHAVLELVPTQFTKGVIVWTTVWGTVVVGPTAEPQTSRDDRRTDEPTVRALIEHGEKCVPALKGATVLGTYAGLRPATEHRDYQIGATPTGGASGWITVAGIRSTGLTAAPGIGEYVAEIYVGLSRDEPPVHVSALGRRARRRQMAAPSASRTPRATRRRRQQPAPAVRNAPVPPLATLAADYRARGDGCVRLYGRPRRVTHPIASYGMEAG